MFKNVQKCSKKQYEISKEKLLISAAVVELKEQSTGRLVSLGFGFVASVALI